MPRLVFSLEQVVDAPQRAMDTPEDGGGLAKLGAQLGLLERFRRFLQALKRKESLTFQGQQMRNRLRACIAWGGCKQVLCNGERPSRLSLCQRQFAPDAGHLSFKEVARFLISWQDGFERRFCARKFSPQDVGQ